MSRPRIPPERQQAAALQAARRMIARGERPMFRLIPSEPGWAVDALPWVRASAFASRGEAIELLRQDVAVVLEVDPWAFDLE